MVELLLMLFRHWMELVQNIILQIYLPFFLNNAREKFSGYEWVKYNIFDINKDIMEQTIAPFSVDIILAANVLHNAKNIHYVFRKFEKKLLKPNGTIIILEETLEAYTLLTSMEFKDGLTGFTDEREQSNFL